MPPRNDDSGSHATTPSLIQVNFSEFACTHVLLTASAGSSLNLSCLDLSEFSCSK
ncbi:hypothetical protein [Rickettsia endosymbiont of Orchestes rusci]|uniref:hypothetical protein n=1 Tax=Rickettsia endosymbiont of Orchestes rusci TaxID=3066250 RepID=UPI00313B845F